MKRMLPLLAAVLIAGCSVNSTPAAPSPSLAAHRVTLGPGEVANADIEAYAIDTATDDSCQRIGTVVVTPPNDFVSHTLTANLPICSATISPVD